MIKAKKPSRKETKAKNKPTLVAFLLDRSGSMNSCKDETIRGFNAYVDELDNKRNGEIRLTLVQFDSQGIDSLCSASLLKDATRLSEDTYQPRASTPLYDAIGKTVRETEKEAGKKYKVLFVTLTDGLENASSEWTKDRIQKLIKEKEDKDNWTFAHIGVGEQGWAATAAYAVGTQSVSNILSTTKADTLNTYVLFADTSARFARSTDNLTKSAQNVWTGKTKDKTSAAK